ncbi:MULTISPECIES: methionine ABC transporter permease [unclassified Facklamia]|uniref:methionine ABC transporter permease n=1 Tax=Aerococcaceae TaxID=186827 RepID=UPI0013B80981|nr:MULTISPECIES: methionine ABC transporter permease [unclassified Facklamia]MBS4461719.1 ABC transporter permease [Aerococcaceae bacterium zg-B36]NEW64007.1 ABC transporter permease subunit [Facklamia sp. 252]NEW67478.1 ABC transporter permease subunit [Facklamia sp. 253]QQD65351.1 ABC transporter permease [Aerococcaceae bacterium zg-252]
MQALIQWYANHFPNAFDLNDEIIAATWETIYMLGLTIVFAGVLGLLFGVIITVTHEGGILENKVVYKALDTLINIFRSIPFIILLALLINVTRFIVGRTIGSTAASVPIIIATIPFFARQVEIALLEVDAGVVEAAQAMGSSPLDIIFRVYLREGLPALLRVSASTVINVIGLTAMAGVVGGGGLGTIAIARGYNRSRMDVILVATFLILVIVFISQVIFNWIIKKIEH